MAGGGLGGGERLEERQAPLGGELGQHESGQHRGGGAEAADQVADLLRHADPDEQQRQVRPGPSGEFGELADQVLLAGDDLGVADGVLEAQHHGDHAAGALLEDVVGEPGPCGGAVERGAERRGQHPAGER